jgi:hypothetical protein
MTMNWISRLGRLLADLYDPSLPDRHLADSDADARRIRSEVDAIRVHFVDLR